MDILVHLPDNAKTVSLGIIFPQPESNIPIKKVSHTRDHKFPVGISGIRFEAESEDGVKRSCEVILNVKGLTVNV